MAWLPKACKLYQNLQLYINDAHSKWWRKFAIALEQIKTDLKISEFKRLPRRKVNEIMLQQKQLWISNNDIDSQNVEQILKCMMFYGKRGIMSDLLSGYYGTENREHWTKSIESSLTYCCIAFGKPNLMNSLLVHDLADMVVIIEFGHYWELSFYHTAFWHMLYWSRKVDNPLHGHNDFCGAILGFLMIFEKECIGNMLSNASEKELQKKIVEIWSSYMDFDEGANISTDEVKLSNEVMRWSNNIEGYGKKLIYQHYNGAINIFKEKGGSNLYFLYAKMALKEKKYLDAKRIFVCAIDEAPSFFIIYLSLRYLSKICKFYGEYGMGLKCLKRAQVFKLLYVENKTQIFEYDKEKGFFRRKLNKKKCSNCGMKKGIKLRSCSGCMKAMYCKRKCQKVHWKRTHHITCDKNWSDNYNILKNTVVFTVKN